MTRSIAIVAVVVLALACITHAQNKKTPTLILKEIKGKTVKLSDYRGKVVLLNFWATWCVPCAAEVPDLVKWQAEYKDKGLQVIGVTYPPTNLAKVRKFIRDNKVTYPILIGAKKTKRLFEHSDTLPITVIVDRRGYTVGRIDGVIFSDEFDEKIKSLLK